MNYYFEPAQGLALNQDLVQQLIKLDRGILTIADDSVYDMSEEKLNEIVEVRHSKKENFLKFYGNNFDDIASVTTWYLPKQLENFILDQYKGFFELLAEPPEIRIQCIHGKQVPVHVDLHRTVSIIHPLQNHSNTWTKFYNHDLDGKRWQLHYSALKDNSWPDCASPWDFQYLSDNIKKELLKDPYTLGVLVDGIRNLTCNVVDPSRVTVVGQIEISNFPWILNTNKCHSVYCPELPTLTNPRLSLFFKWRKTTFVQVTDAYQQYIRIQS